MSEALAVAVAVIRDLPAEIRGCPWPGLAAAAAVLAFGIGSAVTAGLMEVLGATAYGLADERRLRERAWVDREFAAIVAAEEEQ